jgi:hypothetical protein
MGGDNTARAGRAILSILAAFPAGSVHWRTPHPVAHR